MNTLNKLVLSGLTALALNYSPTVLAQSQEAISTLKEGMTMQEVQRNLGKPTGKMKAGNTQLWMYQKGQIKFDNQGTLSYASFMTDKRFQAKEKQKEKWAEDRAKTAKLAMERKIIENKRKAEEARKINEQKKLEDLVKKETGYQPTFTRDPNQFKNEFNYGDVAIVFDNIKIHKSLDKYNISFKKLKKGKEEKVKLITKEFSKHPYETLEKTLSHVNITDTIELKGSGVGGIRSIGDSSISLRNNYVVRGSHSEWSSLLMLKFYKEFDMKNWEKISKKAYGVKKPIGNQNGCLGPYPAPNAEDDFNHYFKELFSQPEKVFNLADKYDKIKQKEEHARKFIGTVIKKTTGNDIKVTRQYLRDVHSGKIKYSAPKK